MFHKYLKFILLSTVFIQASPKAFDSLGNELEVFQKDCTTYQKVSSLPAKIKKKCKNFNSQTNKAFKVGYKLDPYIDSDNISKKKLNRYLALLRKLDKRKEDILNLIYSEAKKARTQNNTKYYSQLIVNDKIKLYSSDYEFMEKNKSIFGQNKRYISHINYLKNLKKYLGDLQRVPPKATVIKNEKAKKKSSTPNNYSITSINALGFESTNTDSDPLNDDAIVHILFGNSQGQHINPPSGVNFNYSLSIYKYQNETLGKLLTSSKGQVTSKNGVPKVFVKMPELLTRTMVLIKMEVTLPSGTLVKKQSKLHFEP